MAHYVGIRPVLPCSYTVLAHYSGRWLCLAIGNASVAPERATIPPSARVSGARPTNTVLEHLDVKTPPVLGVLRTSSDLWDEPKYLQKLRSREMLIT